MPRYAVHVDEVAETTTGPDGVTATHTFTAAAGGWELVQHVLRVPAGVRHDREPDVREEILGVVAGRGSIHLPAESFPLEPDTGAYVAPGERYALESDGPEDLVVVSVLTPPGPTPLGWRRPDVVRYREQEAHRAGKDREYRHLVGSCATTQFIGTIPVGRARDHYHHYEEVAYVLDGEGVMHMDGEPDVRLRPGLCIHFVPRLPHCLENTGDRPLRVLGVFTPPGSPADAYNIEGR
jgi:mannose-6-phosphate isomerase-like protein (cupin superfamily)